MKSSKFDNCSLRHFNPVSDITESLYLTSIVGYVYDSTKSIQEGLFLANKDRLIFLMFAK